MNFEKKEEWDRFISRVFEGFAEIFRHGMFLSLIIVLQFAIQETCIYFIHIKDNELFIYGVLRLSNLFSIFFYGCSHIACRSYTSRKSQQLGGLMKYRSRATKNFIAGFILFCISLIVLISLSF